MAPILLKRLLGLTGRGFEGGDLMRHRESGRSFRFRAPERRDKEGGQGIMVVSNLAPARETPVRIIARNRAGQVKLVPVSLPVLADIQLDNVADMLCVNIHECGVSTTIKEVRHFCKKYWSADADTAPCIFVLGSMKRLSTEELWVISQEMESAGGIFHAWPEDCDSFAAAFDSLASELGRHYATQEDSFFIPRGNR